MNRRQTIFVALTFLAIMTACVVPGFPTASAPLSAPTTDPGQLEAMVAETVSAAIEKTEQAHPTRTPAPTQQPTQTDTPEPVTYGSALAVQDDGSALFVDEHAGYQITIPSGWLAVRVDEKEYYDAWNLAEAADPNIQALLLGMKEQDPNTHRLLVMDTQDGHIQNEFVTDIEFIWDEQAAFNGIEDLQVIAEKIPAETGAFKFEVTSTQLITAITGVQFGVIEAKSSFTNASNETVNIYQKRIFFKAKTGMQSIVFTTLESLKESTLPAFEAMIETIALVAE